MPERLLERRSGGIERCYWCFRAVLRCNRWVQEESPRRDAGGGDLDSDRNGCLSVRG